MLNSQRFPRSISIWVGGPQIQTEHSQQDTGDGSGGERHNGSRDSEVRPRGTNRYAIPYFSSKVRTKAFRRLILFGKAALYPLIALSPSYNVNLSLTLLVDVIRFQNAAEKALILRCLLYPIQPVHFTKEKSEKFHEIISLIDKSIFEENIYDASAKFAWKCKKKTYLTKNYISCILSVIALKINFTNPLVLNNIHKIGKKFFQFKHIQTKQ